MITWLRPCVLTVTILASCLAAAATERTKGTLDQYRQYAGPPVRSFTYLGTYQDFTTVGPYDVVLWTTVNDAWLISVQPPCNGLVFARGIRLTQTFNTVTARVDKLKFQDQICFITQIRPVNYLKMKQELHTGP